MSESPSVPVDIQEPTPKSGNPDAYLLDRFSVFRAYIEHEDNLINQRMNWFIQLHSFLIASYGLVFSAVVDVFTSESSTAGAALASPTVMLLYGFAIVGLISSVTTFVSVGAARSAIDSINKQWQLLLESNGRPEDPKAGQNSAGVNRAKSKEHLRWERLPGMIGGGRKANVFTGFALAQSLPIVVALLWAIALVCFTPMVRKSMQAASDFGSEATTKNIRSFAPVASTQALGTPAH